MAGRLALLLTTVVASRTAATGVAMVVDGRKPAAIIMTVLTILAGADMGGMFTGSTTAVMAALAATHYSVMVHLEGGPPGAVVMTLVTLLAGGNML